MKKINEKVNVVRVHEMDEFGSIDFDVSINGDVADTVVAQFDESQVDLNNYIFDEYAETDLSNEEKLSLAKYMFETKESKNEQ